MRFASVPAPMRSSASRRWLAAFAAWSVSSCSADRSAARDPDVIDLVSVQPMSAVEMAGFQGPKSSNTGGKQSVDEPQQDSMLIRRGLLVSRDTALRVLRDSSVIALSQKSFGSAPRIAIRLFGDTRIVGVLDQASRGDAGIVWSGRILTADSITTGTFVLADHAGGLLGTVRMQGGDYYELLPVGKDSTLVQQRRPAPSLERLSPREPPARAPRRQSSVPPGIARRPADPLRATSAAAPRETADGSVIDVVVGFTPAARAAAAQRWGLSPTADAPIRQHAQAAVDEANIALRESQVSTRLRLVATTVVAYVEPSPGIKHLDPMLTALQKGGAPFNVLQALAVTHRADVVLCLTVSRLEGGLAYVLREDYLDGGFGPYAVGVVEWETARSNFNLAHESGHLLGAEHDAAHASRPGAYAYSYGWHFDVDNQQFHDIMAYARGTSDRTVQRFANPAIRFPLGHPRAQPTGAAGVADVAATINQTRRIIANVR